MTLFPGSHIDRTVLAPSDYPEGGSEGAVLLVEFTLGSRPFVALNGGPLFPFTEAVSFQFETADQAETDRLSDALVADGGVQSNCGWVKDRWGLSWQIVPRPLRALLSSPDADAARRVNEAMLAMKRLDIAALERAAGSGAA